jgi:chemosensory pili system protein ChpA (sensor histidine kinase/response regulator)
MAVAEAAALVVDTRPQVSSQTLEAVAREITVALGEAREALEAYVEKSDNAQLLTRCSEELRQVQGVLRVLEIHGAALLAEEMRQVVHYLQDGGPGLRKNQPEALDGLMRAMVQLPSYLERVMAGGRDLALVLLPLLNDLRAVRGSALLSEGTLLLLNLKSDRQPRPMPAAPGEEDVTVAQWARRLRARFQVGLIGWIRGERVGQNLEILAGVAARLEQVATTQAVFQLWWVTGALVEALREYGLESSVSIKRLLGLADREIKRLHDEGESRYAQDPPVELLNNLLYYIARATNNGPRVTAVREDFRLGELLPVDESIEQERENLSAPSVKLMQTVAAAIREDLGKIKDVLDIFVRRGGASPEELAPQVDLLRKIGDTLGVLGLGEQRARVQGEITRLEQLISGREKPADSVLVDIAATLIRVEDHLDDELVAMILPRNGETASAELDVDFQQVQSAVLRECIVNLARVKEYVTQNVGGTLDTSGFDNWIELMRGIQAGLLMLGKTRAVSCIDRVTANLRSVMQPDGPGLSREALDRLADAIVSIEYYMETLQAGRSDPWYMLDNAEAAIAAVDDMPPRGVPTVPPVGLASPYDRTVRIDRPQPVEAVSLAPEASRPALIDPPVLKPLPGRVPVMPVEPADLELQALFLEEAGEEVARIVQAFPVWDQNPLEEDALVTVRRAFHTLKGSGRMVGARELSDFAWSIENLLNRLLDKTLTRSPPILALLREAILALPELVTQLAGGAAPTADTVGIALRAHALAAGRQESSAIPSSSPLALNGTLVMAASAPEAVATGLLPELLAGELQPGDRPEDADVAAVLPEAPYPGDVAEITDRAPTLLVPEPVSPALPEPVAETDTTLRDIYARETGSHVAVVRDWLARQAHEPAPHLLSEPVYRACHTLAGSSKMAEARHGIRLTEPLNHWLRKVYDSGVGLTDEDLQLVGDCMTAMESVSRNLDEDTGFFPLHGSLRERVAAAESALEQRILQEQGGRSSRLPTEPAAGDMAAHAAVSGADDDSRLDPDYDPEIASIFGEEATELLDEAQSCLSSIRPEANNSEEFAALKRPLHTLKGGARMAGVTAMGDLAHELESLITGIEVGTIAPSPESRAGLQVALDELARMRDLLAAGQRVGSAEGVLARIRALSGELEAEAGVDSGLAAPAPSPEPEFLPLPPETPPEPLPESPPREPALAPALVPPGREPTVPADRQELARVDAELLNQLLNNAGEVSIARSRVEQQVGSVEFNLGELSRTVTRLKDQLRKLEIETETQILHRHQNEGDDRGDFDPLELDRYSSIQQFSRALAETAADVASIQSLLESLTQETQNLLQQQGRTITELQNGLMRTRMVSFQRHVTRLSRIVRQAAADTGKKADLVVEGATGELDRQVLERMLPPFEHLLRNAIVHGIETPEARVAAGKDETGQIRLVLRREGAEVIVEVSDDGAGMDLEAIRGKAEGLGLTRPGQQLSDEEVMQLILEPGFSTAASLTQAAGRGVGMDVVATEVKKLGGALHMETKAGEGSRFVIRLPFTLAVSHALVVRIGEELYALPLPTVEGVVRLSKADIEQHLASDVPSYVYGGHRYRFQHLGVFVGQEPGPLPDTDATLPVVLVRAGEHSTGLVAEELIGSREIVVKPVGPQISAIRGISGATILGDGRVVIILDIGALVRAGWRGRGQGYAVPREKTDRRVVALVVDDSITVRRVTQRLLERNGLRVLTARDGMDAVAVMQDHVPDIILLDIEMPRMDGYEVAAHVRGDERLKHVPIIMITSRVGEKHRARAIELGVDDYLGKPYQESQLLDAIAPLVAHRQQVLPASG